MKFLLDTNICIYLIKHKPPQVIDRFRACELGDIAISSITVAELDYGIAKSQQRDRNQAALDRFLLPLTSPSIALPAITMANFATASNARDNRSATWTYSSRPTPSA
nr:MULTISPECIES: PIN domain-containing protein [unclassified Limnothrix]